MHELAFLRAALQGVSGNTLDVLREKWTEVALTDSPNLSEEDNEEASQLAVEIVHLVNNEEARRNLK